jgi:hypothetical protein
MLASAGPVPSGRRWAYEVKFDGILNRTTGEPGPFRRPSWVGLRPDLGLNDLRGPGG